MVSRLTAFLAGVTAIVAVLLTWLLAFTDAANGFQHSRFPARCCGDSEPGVDPAVLPVVSATNGYVGSSSCQECHADPYESWHRSYHRTMTQLADAKTVKARFDHVVLTNDGTRFTLSTRSNELWVRMERAAQRNSDSVQPGARPRRPSHW
jgi:hypothetical protein